MIAAKQTNVRITCETCNNRARPGLAYCDDCIKELESDFRRESNEADYRRF